MANRPPVLYHGSPVPLERLEPRQASGVGPEHDNLNAVYATHLKNFAIAFAMKPVDGTMAWELHMNPDGTPRIRYMAGRPNVGGVGYVYLLPSDTFEQIDEEQWVSYVAVTPIECEVIQVDDYLHWVEGLSAKSSG